MSSYALQRAPFTARRGTASLTTTLLLGGLVVEIGLVLLFLFYLLNFTNYGIRISAEAFTGARAGIEDALLRIVRDKCVAFSYDMPMANNGPQVAGTVSGPSVACDGQGPQPMLETREINARSTLIGKRRRIQAFAEMNNHTGLVKVLRAEEVPF